MPQSRRALSAKNAAPLVVTVALLASLSIAEGSQVTIAKATQLQAQVEALAKAKCGHVSAKPLDSSDMKNAKRIMRSDPNWRPDPADVEHWVNYVCTKRPAKMPRMVSGAAAKAATAATEAVMPAGQPMGQAQPMAQPMAQPQAAGAGNIAPAFQQVQAQPQLQQTMPAGVLNTGLNTIQPMQQAAPAVADAGAVPDGVATADALADANAGAAGDAVGGATDAAVDAAAGGQDPFAAPGEQSTYGGAGAGAPRRAAGVSSGGVTNSHFGSFFIGLAVGLMIMYGLIQQKIIDKRLL